MEKLYVCYLMNNLIEDINDTKKDMNLSITERGNFIDKNV